MGGTDWGKNEIPKCIVESFNNTKMKILCQVFFFQYR